MPYRDNRRARPGPDPDPAPPKPRRRSLRPHRIGLINGAIDEHLATGYTTGPEKMMLWGPRVKGVPQVIRVYNNATWLWIDWGAAIPGTKELDEIGAADEGDKD